MRILMISPQYRPIVGGYERAAERLSQALAARGNAVTVIAERRDRSWPAHEIRDGVEIRRLWCLYRPGLHIMTSLMNLAFFLTAEGRRFDVWRIHQYGAHAVLAAALAKLLRRPLVLKTTSSGDGGIEWVASQLPFAGLARRMLRQVGATVAISREVVAEALAFGMPADRVRLIGNGIDIERFKPCSEEERQQLRKDLGVEASGLAVYVGRLSPEKNPDGLVRAWGKAFPKLPAGWRLAIVGDGPMREQLASLVAAMGLLASTILAGFRSDVESWTGAADLLALPSHREGLSNTVLEAMATGLAVVSTNVSGANELLADTGGGVVVEVGQEAQIAEAIVLLATDAELRARMGWAGRKVIEEKFSIQSIAASYERLYRHLLYRDPGPASPSFPQF